MGTTTLNNLFSDNYSFLGHELAIAKEWLSYCQENRLMTELEYAWSYYMLTLDKCRELKAIANMLGQVSTELGLKVA